ncbi:MAG: hypothetical protein ACK4L4_20075, partial [Gemmobacter sp.]
AAYRELVGVEATRAAHSLVVAHTVFEAAPASVTAAEEAQAPAFTAALGRALQCASVTWEETRPRLAASVRVCAQTPRAPLLRCLLGTASAVGGHAAVPATAAAAAAATAAAVRWRAASEGKAEAEARESKDALEEAGPTARAARVLGLPPPLIMPVRMCTRVFASRTGPLLQPAFALEWGEFVLTLCEACAEEMQ